jgi:hypothetical protein
MPTEKALDFQEFFLSRPSSSRKPFVQRRVAHAHQERDAWNAESGAFHKAPEGRDERLVLLLPGTERRLPSPARRTIELPISIHTSIMRKGGDLRCNFKTEISTIEGTEGEFSTETCGLRIAESSVSLR